MVSVSVLLGSSGRVEPLFSLLAILPLAEGGAADGVFPVPLQPAKVAAAKAAARISAEILCAFMNNPLSKNENNKGPTE